MSEVQLFSDIRVTSALNQWKKPKRRRRGVNNSFGGEIFFIVDFSSTFWFSR